MDVVVEVKLIGYLGSKTTYPLGSVRFLDLNDVLVLEHVLLTHALRTMLHARPPHQGVLERANNRLVQLVTEIFNRAILLVQNDWFVEVRLRTSRHRVHANQIEILPNLLQQTVQVPLFFRRRHDVVLHVIHELQFFQRNGVHLIHRVHRRGVDAVTLDDINQFLIRAIREELDVGVVNLVLGANALHRLFVQEGCLPVGVRRERDPTFFFPVKSDRRRFLVQAYAHTLQFVFD